jgi:thiosulfate reductase cytochrome b subunit
LRNVDAMIRYYLYGIFHGGKHPFNKTVLQKHNPLQRLAYLAFLALMGPMIWGSGLLYLFYNQWPRFFHETCRRINNTWLLAHSSSRSCCRCCCHHKTIMDTCYES